MMNRALLDIYFRTLIESHLHKRSLQRFVAEKCPAHIRIQTRGAFVNEGCARLLCFNHCHLNGDVMAEKILGQCDTTVNELRSSRFSPSRSLYWTARPLLAI